MHPTKPFGCIYVELTLNSAVMAATHKGFGKVSDETSTQVVDWTINKWRVKIAWRELYNVRDPPRRRGQKICKENTVALSTATVIKSKRNILKNYSPQTLPRKNFCAPHLSIHCFSLLSYHLSLLRSLSISLKPNFLTHSLQIYCTGLLKP